MVMYRRTFLDFPVYNFIGDEHEWRKLVIESSKRFKQVYLFDYEANRRMYPPEVKVITSVQTMKRLNFVSLGDSAVFIGEMKQKDFIPMNWNRSKYVALRTNLKRLLEISRDNLLEESSRRNIRYLRKYK